MDFVLARQNMVDCQLRPNGLTDSALLQALETLPREEFVPPSRRAHAYVDADVPLGRGRFLMQPLIMARLLQSLRLGPRDTVLVVGAGSGYMAAAVGEIVHFVFAVEQDAQLQARATEILTAQGMDNVVVVKGAPQDGYVKEAPYDAIVIDGAVPDIPQTLLDQLTVGGRLAAVVVTSENMGQAVLCRKMEKTVEQQMLFDAKTAFLPGFAAKMEFVF